LRCPGKLNHSSYLIPLDYNISLFNSQYEIFFKRKPKEFEIHAYLSDIMDALKILSIRKINFIEDTADKPIESQILAFNVYDDGTMQKMKNHNFICERACAVLREIENDRRNVN